MDEQLENKSNKSGTPNNYGSFQPLEPVEESTSFKWKTGYSCLSLLCFLVFAIIIMIMAIVAYNGLSDKGDAILDFQNNWKLSPIVDIKTSDSTCPEGYSSLLNTRWPGTDTGCDCTHMLWSVFSSKKVYRGYCGSQRRDDGCVNIWSTSSKSLEFLDSYRICGKREGPSYYKLPMPEKTTENTVKCPDGYQVCGTGDHHNSIWVKTSSKCPINDVYIADSKSAVPNGYQRAELSDGQVLLFTSTNSTLPVSRFKLTEGKVCANPDERDKSVGRNVYVLMSKGRDGCTTKIAGNLYDPRWKYLTSVSEDTLFEENNLNSVLQRLPSYPWSEAKNYKWNFYTEDFIYWNQKCEADETMTRERMMKRLDKADSFLAYQKIIMIFSITIASWVFLWALIWSCMLCASKSMNYDQELAMQACYLGFFFFVYVILTIIMLVYLFVASKGIKDYSSANMECSDAYTNSIFKEFRDDANKTNRLNIANLVLTLITLAMFLVISIIVLTRFRK